MLGGGEDRGGLDLENPGSVAFSFPRNRYQYSEHYRESWGSPELPGGIPH